MVDQSPFPKTIVVAGDVTVDWNLMSNLESAGEDAVLANRNFTRICCQPGGVLMLANLIEKLADAFNGSVQQATRWTVQRMANPEQSIHPDDAQFSHSCANWQRFPIKKGVKENKIWRVKEFLGIDRASTATAFEPPAENDDPDAAVVALDDAALGYRDHKELWPKALSNPQNHPWVLLKMARPVAQGGLWEKLRREHAERLVVIIPVDDLRLTDVQISRELSWERTAQDVAWELAYNPRVNALADCAHVIVTFKNAGAVLVSRGQPESQAAGVRPLPQCRLIFDPRVVEGMWEQDYEGQMIGYHTCLAASLAYQLMQETPDFVQGIKAGLSAMRTLHQKGYDEQACGTGHSVLVFPEGAVLKEIASPAQDFAQVEIQFPTRLLLHKEKVDEKHHPLEVGLWTILQEKYTGDLAATARKIVVDGADAALKNVPLGVFGDLTTVDRREIESFRSIRTLINEYCAQKRPKRPLSIAVFGPPGSGKSFGVTQVAKSLRPGEIEDITFNLSQMKSPDELVDAFHQIRDKSLKGIIPLVFWDEFDLPLGDTQLGWLRYFLAPMQDGEFTEGQLRHPLGKAIFVFAGGTSETIGLFDKGISPAFKDVKGPDFISRLRGFVNILGANPPKDADKSDPYYIIRRAILLRSIISRAAPHLFSGGDGKGTLNIDRGVLDALLKVKVYKHGARSMEALMNMSMLAGKTKFERSSLPSEAQLNLHVDGQNFFSQMQQADFEEGRLEALARASHEIYCEGLLARHEATTNLVPYDQLTTDYQELNKAYVRDIIHKINEGQYELVHARSNELALDFPGDILQELAEEEHNRWMKEKLRANRTPPWRYGEPRNDELGLHPALLPWRDYSALEKERLFTAEEWSRIGSLILPINEKEKDFDMVQGIPSIVARAGYAVIKAHSEAEE